MEKLGARSPNNAVAIVPELQAKIDVVEGDMEVLFVQPADLQKNALSDGETGAGDGGEGACERELVAVPRIISPRQPKKMGHARPLDRARHLRVARVRRYREASRQPRRRPGRTACETISRSHPASMTCTSLLSSSRTSPRACLAPALLRDAKLNGPGCGDNPDTIRMIILQALEQGMCGGLVAVVVDDEQLQFTVVGPPQHAFGALLQQFRPIAGRHDNRHHRQRQRQRPHDMANKGASGAGSSFASVCRERQDGPARRADDAVATVSFSIAATASRSGPMFASLR